MIALFCLGMVFTLFNSLELLLIEYQMKAHVFFEKEISVLSKKEKNKDVAKEEPVKVNKASPESIYDIVGKTRTELIDISSITDNNKIKQEKSVKEEESDPIPNMPDIPLESNDPAYMEDDDINPDDIDITVKSLSLKEILEEEDPEMFLHNDMPSEGFSSGLSFEQLNETYEGLTSGKMNKIQESEAKKVLISAEGTPIFDFFTVHEKCKEKAQLLFDVENNDTNANNDEFDIKKYL
ncbi:MULTISPECIES: hypothetical protein [unclassified Dysgonomonas]|uniref:hypothetical protein n=1 Tax=unclassified Dysgonomonas TaxID=2630389 RepID=UPI002476EDCE|nr:MULTISPECIES: hypothetical protein [unclassified Dysgonomonas]